MLALVALGKRWPSPLRYGLLLVALLKFAMPPMLPLQVGVFSVAGPTIAAVHPQTSVADTSRGMPATVNEPRGTGFLFPMNTPAGHAPIAEVYQQADPPIGVARTDSADPLWSTLGQMNAATWGLVVHLMGFLCVSVYFLYQIAYLLCSIRKGRPLTPGPLFDSYSDLCRELKIR
jgi:hypothetical protein